MAASDEHKNANTATGRLRAVAAWFDPDEPHPYRGPFARWPRAADVVLAVAAFGGSLIAVAASALDDNEGFTFGSINDRPLGAIAVLAAASAVLVWRRAHPIGVTTAVMALMVIWALAGYGDGQELALVIATYSVGRYCADHRQSLVTLAAVITTSLLGTIIDPNQRVDIAPALLLSVLPWYVGYRIRNRGDYVALLQDRARRLDAEQQARAKQAVATERARIARELHDVVAHRVSMMTIQAGAAKTIARDDLDTAIEAMGEVEQAGRQAIGELRHLLGVLRPDSGDSDHLGPQPGIADIGELVDELTHTGAAVTLVVPELPDDLPAAVDLSAYRIVQESVTNVLKHAGRNPRVDITVTVDRHQLVLDITNSTDGASTGLPASGYGIAGMQERASLLGGTLTTAPEPPGHYRVHACLPLEPEPT